MISKKRLREPEHEEQKAFITWVRLQHPKLIVAAIPNGGQRGKAQAGKLKAEGVLAGMPDIMIAHANGVYHGMFIEMKSKDGKLSKSQKAIKAQLESEGYKVEVCYSWIEAKEKLTEYLKQVA